MPERQCVGCTRQKEWGCHAKKITNAAGEEEWINPAYLPVMFLGEETWACPRQPVREDGRVFNRILTFYGTYKSGFLPQAGAVVDQSNFAMEVFALIDDVVHECDNAEDEAKAKKKAAAQDRADRYAGAGKGDPRQRG